MDETDEGHEDFFFSTYMAEIEAIDGIIREFSWELLGDDEEPVTEFHFGCNADRIEWDDKEFSHMEIAPAVVIAINFAEMPGMPGNAAATQTIQKLLLRGPYRRRAREALSEAIRLERQRIAAGKGTGEDLALIRE